MRHDERTGSAPSANAPENGASTKHSIKLVVGWGTGDRRGPPVSDNRQQEPDMHRYWTFVKRRGFCLGPARTFVETADRWSSARSGNRRMPGRPFPRAANVRGSTGYAPFCLEMPGGTGYAFLWTPERMRDMHSRRMSQRVRRICVVRAMRAFAGAGGGAKAASPRAAAGIRANVQKAFGYKIHHTWTFKSLIRSKQSLDIGHEDHAKL